MTLPTSTPESSPRVKASPNRPQTGLFPMLWLIFATSTLPTGTPEPSSIIIPVTFRLRLEKNTEQAHRAYRHLRGRLSCSVKPIGPHRASEYALHPPGTAFGLLGVLLEGLSGNRHRLPHQEPSHNRSPAVLRLISGRVLAQCPVGLPMLPAAVCHLSAAGTPTASWFSALGRRPKTISRRDVSPRPRRRRGSLLSGAQPSSPAPFRRE